jgi:hypothetical protein
MRCVSAIREDRCPEDRGWPRLTCPYEVRTSVRMSSVQNRTGWALGFRQLPSPWINGDSPERHGDWLTFEEGRCEEAYHKRACVVCGEPTQGAVVFGSATNGQQQTSGPGGHPRCLWLAANTCPNLLDSEKVVVAWLYIGDGRGHMSPPAEEQEDPYSDGDYQDIDPSAFPLTRSELQALARADPLGTLVAQVPIIC